MSPTSKRPSLKDPELYDTLTGQGMSEGKAARISNAAAREGRSEIGRRGGHGEDYDARTVSELRARAKELGLTGYSGRRKSELIEMLREH